MKKLLVLLFAVLAAGCLTDKKLGEHARRYYAEHPELFASDCNNKFPTVILPGTVITKSDTIISPGITVPCPDQIVVDSAGRPVTDPTTGNVKTTPGKQIICPPSFTIHDTLKLHDTILPGPLLAVLTGDTAAKGQALRVETGKRTEAERKAKNRLYGCILFFVTTLFCGYILLKR